ncbi:MAG: CPBP family intramembrane metalloprotease [Clostridia bacterium]|nr:CPBP family intramembrane metalloprotease [Clostridia bacterium]
MTKFNKEGNIASLMMLVWLAFYIFGAVFASRWADFVGILGCTVPMLLLKHNIRGRTFGASDCNTVKYKKSEYALFFVFCIGGCALLAASTLLLAKLGGAQGVAETALRGDFFYLLVFSCILPAFFEEWLLRGGVLGSLAKLGGSGVWMCAVLFMLMHVAPEKWAYALFAGLMLTALVYLTECIYLGMLLHFCNNFTSLLLSYLPSGAEPIMLLVITAVFVVSLLLLMRGELLADTVRLLRDVHGAKLRELLTPPFWVFALVILFIILL